MTPEKNRTRLLFALLLAPALTAACSGILSSGEPPRQTYLLEPLESTGGTSTGAPLSLSISSIPGLDTDRILAVATDNRLNHYANARWSDNLPDVLSSVVRRSLDASGRFRSVAISQRAPEDGWSARLEIEQFFGRQNADGETTSVSASMSGTISCNDGDFRLSLSESVPVSAQRLSAVVAAHQAALDGLTRQLMDGIDRNCPET
ncbi:MAG: ABC-type transport auxiliary lipoprotein family protein [Lysobacterales bacterium]